MKIRTNVKAGEMTANHNEAQVQDSKQASGLRVKTNVKAGVLSRALLCAGSHRRMLAYAGRSLDGAHPKRRFDGIGGTSASRARSSNLGT